jgi:hypothetical protein
MSLILILLVSNAYPSTLINPKLVIHIPRNHPKFYLLLAHLDCQECSQTLIRWEHLFCGFISWAWGYIFTLESGSIFTSTSIQYMEG